MKITPTKIKDVLVIEPDVFGDHRGWFMESYNKTKFADMGIDVEFVQDNHSMNVAVGTLRGLHFQKAPTSQTKLVRCIKGALLDVVVDLRKDSPTYKEWVGEELSAENKKQLMVPEGFAHGYITLTDDVEMQYKVDKLYSPENDRSIRFDDPEIGINWGNIDPIISDKDKSAPFLKDSDANF